jgi:hypothetical protein
MMLIWKCTVSSGEETLESGRFSMLEMVDTRQIRPRE